MEAPSSTSSSKLVAWPHRLPFLCWAAGFDKTRRKQCSFSSDERHSKTRERGGQHRVLVPSTCGIGINGKSFGSTQVLHTALESCLSILNL